MIFLTGSLLLLTVFLIPLLGIINNLGYEQIKVFFFAGLLSIIGFVWIIFSFKHKIKITWSPVSQVALVFIGILFVTSLLGVNRWNSFLGVWSYFQGWILYAYLYLFFSLVSWSQVKLEKWSFCLAAASLIVGFLAIKDWVLLNLFSISVPTYAGRVVSSFGQPNFYGGFLLLALPFSYLLFKNPDKKLQFLGWGSGLIAMVGILISYSRSTILLALLLLLLGLMNELRIKFNVGLIAGAVILGSIATALVVSSGIVGNEVSRPILTRNPDLTKESIEKRAYIWPTAFRIVSQKPFLGYGLENIGKAFSDYFEENKHSLFEENLKISPVLISLKELKINRSHNYLLDLLLFSGILGLSGWLGLVGMLFNKLRQNIHDREQNVLLVSLITYLVWIQFQNQSVVHLVYFWLLVGLINSTIRYRY